MNCCRCSAEIGTTLALVPCEDGHDWMCEACLVTSGLLCDKHDTVHTMFTSPKSHACLQCIDDAVTADAGAAPGYHARIMAVLGPDGTEEVDDWIDVVLSLAPDASRPLALLRAIATLAARSGVSHEDVVRRVERSCDASDLLPSCPFL